MSPPSEIYPLGLRPGQVPIRISIAEEWVIQSLGLVRTSKIKLTLAVRETSGSLYNGGPIKASLKPVNVKHRWNVRGKQQRVSNFRPRRFALRKIRVHAPSGCKGLKNVYWYPTPATRRIDDDHGKAFELAGSCIKCMRGILTCWMRQSERVEQFKKAQNFKFALHSKFHLLSGEEVCSTSQYEHLQVGGLCFYPGTYFFYFFLLIFFFKYIFSK